MGVARGLAAAALLVLAAGCGTSEPVESTVSPSMPAFSETTSSPIYSPPQPPPTPEPPPPPPEPEVTVEPAPAEVKPPPTPDCDQNYEGGCVPVASDVDCAGGSGNGPAYVDGPVRVVGEDVYGLDRDGDGIACDS